MMQGDMLGGEVVQVAKGITHMSPVATIDEPTGRCRDMFVPPPRLLVLRVPQAWVGRPLVDSPAEDSSRRSNRAPPIRHRWYR